MGENRHELAPGMREYHKPLPPDTTHRVIPWGLILCVVFVLLDIFVITRVFDWAQAAFEAQEPVIGVSADEIRYNPLRPFARLLLAGAVTVVLIISQGLILLVYLRRRHG